MTYSFVTSGAAVQATYNSVLIAVCGGYVYLGYSQPVAQLIRALGQAAGPPLSTTNIVSIAIINQHAYIVDGVNGIIDVDLLSASVIPYVVTTGTAPVTPTLAANWRGRLMLNASTNPQNLYASRVSNPYDWDFSALDSAAAFVDDPAAAGKIGEPITALIPYTDDYFIIGASHSMFMYQGDPAAGGTNTIISQNMGVVGKDAWAIDPEGTLYYIATGGLFSVRPIWEFYRPPENLTKTKYNQFFQFLNPGTQIISLVWDADLHYLHMFVSPIGGATQGLSLIYDSRKGGLWPQQFPANIGPSASCFYLANNDPNQRAIFLGGFDGYIRRFILGAANSTVFDDDGTAINAFVTLGPISPFPGASLLTGLTIDLGELGPNQPEPNVINQIDDFTGDGTTETFTLSQLPEPGPIVVTVGGRTIYPATDPTDYFTGDGSTTDFYLSYTAINDTMTATVNAISIPQQALPATTQTDDFTGDGSTTSFNLSNDAFNPTMVATVNSITVPRTTVNPPAAGFFLAEGDVIQFGAAPVSGAAIVVQYCLGSITPNPGYFFPVDNAILFGTAPANGAAIVVSYDTMEEEYGPVTEYTIVTNTITFDNPPGYGDPILVDYYYNLTTTNFWNAVATIDSGPDAFSVTEGTPHSTYSVNMPTDRRQKCFRQRLRGRWFTLTIGNNVDNTYFSFESAIAEFDQAGRQRTIR
jgi:hypothetical protein